MQCCTSIFGTKFGRVSFQTSTNTNIEFWGERGLIFCQDVFSLTVFKKIFFAQSGPKDRVKNILEKQVLESVEPPKRFFLGF